MLTITYALLSVGNSCTDLCLCHSEQFRQNHFHFRCFKSSCHWFYKDPRWNTVPIISPDYSRTVHHFLLKQLPSFGKMRISFYSKLSFWACKNDRYPFWKNPPRKISTPQTFPRKIPTQKIPTWNIPTHFINCLSSLNTSSINPDQIFHETLAMLKNCSYKTFFQP